MKTTSIPYVLLVLLLSMAGCKKDINKTEHLLYFRFNFDSTQVRLNNFGQPDTIIPSGHGAQSPLMHKMSAHYIELAADSLTPLGSGYVLYKAYETNQGGATAIDFSQAFIVGANTTFFSIPVESLTPGTYRWLRVSLSYQNYDVNFKYGSMMLQGRLASFIGYNTYIGSFAPNDHSVTVNANKLQGYWGFEIDTMGFDTVFTGQAAGTTVPNPISASSPIPPGSCVVTGEFAEPLVITGQEDHDVGIIVSLSVNKSFEWKDLSGDNIYEPPYDTVVDMGVRGMIPTVQ